MLVTFDELPDDIIINIFKHVNCVSVPKLCHLSKRYKFLCYERYIETLRYEIEYKTGLYLRGYNLRQIAFLDRVYDTIKHDKISSECYRILAVFNDSIHEFGKRKKYTINLEDIVDIACGCLHTLLLTRYGSVYGIGSNSSGELGVGDTDYRKDIITKIPYYNNVIKVIASGNASVFLTKDGNVYNFGYNNDNLILNPKLMIGFSNIVQIIFGRCILLTLDKSGKIMGYNYHNHAYIEYINCPLNIIYITMNMDDKCIVIDNNGIIYKHSSCDTWVIILFELKAIKITYLRYNLIILTENGDVYSISNLTIKLKINNIINIYDNNDNLFLINNDKEIYKYNISSLEWYNKDPTLLTIYNLTDDMVENMI